MSMVLLVAGAALAGVSRVAAQDGGGAISGLDPQLWQTSSPSWNGLRWEQLAPGDGGTCFYLRIHPQDPNRVIESKDMGGTYLTTDGSRTYQSVNDPDWTFPRLHYLNSVDFCRANPDIGYAVSDSNGAFRTGDRGRSWVPLDTAPLDALDPTRRRQPLAAVAVHPDNPAEVWVGTGRPRNAGDKRLVNGMACSLDGGVTWRLVPDAIPPDAMLRKLVIAPQAWGVGKALLAATDRGFLVSHDGGETWAEKGRNGLPHQGLVDLDAVFDGARKKVVLAVTLTSQAKRSGDGIEFAGGVWRSEDLGETWTDATGNLRLPTALVLAAPDARPEQWSTPVNRITLDGATRAEIAERLEKSPCILPDFHTVRLDPRNPQVIYASIFQPWFPYGVWKTTDGGQSWVCTVRGAQGWLDPAWADYRPAAGPVLNVEQVWTAKHPMNWGTDRCVFGLWDTRIFDLCTSNPDVLYFHTHRVTYRSDDGGATWRDISNHVVPDADGGFMGSGNSNMCVFDVAFHPQAPGRMLFAMADCGVKTSRDGGRSLHPMPGASFGSNQWVYTTAFDPDDPDRFWQFFGCLDWLVGGIKGTYFLESRDFGRTCDGVTVAPNGSVSLPPPVAVASAQVNRLLVDPRSPKDRRRFVAAQSSADRLAISSGGSGLLSGDGQGILISEDHGQTWTPSNTGLDPDNLSVVDLVVGPAGFDILYAAVFLRIKGGVSLPGGLYRSTDSGRSWSRLTGLPLASVAQVVALPNGTLYVAGGYGNGRDSGGGIYRSTDGGTNWQQLLAAPCVSTLAVSPHDPQVVYCTVDAGPAGLRPDVLGGGVWRSADAGATWRRANRGLATNYRFTFLRFNPLVPGEVWVGTFGSGWYRAADPRW